MVNIELRVGPDANRRHGLIPLIAMRLSGTHLGLEDLGVEAAKFVDVLRNDGEVVDSIQKHYRLLALGTS
jgi:hypothetical protein